MVAATLVIALILSRSIDWKDEAMSIDGMSRATREHNDGPGSHPGYTIAWPETKVSMSSASADCSRTPASLVLAARTPHACRVHLKGTGTRISSCRRFLYRSGARKARGGRAARGTSCRCSRQTVAGSQEHGVHRPLPSPRDAAEQSQRRSGELVNSLKLSTLKFFWLLPSISCVAFITFSLYKYAKG